MKSKDRCRIQPCCVQLTRDSNLDNLAISLIRKQNRKQKGDASKKNGNRDQYLDEDISFGGTDVNNDDDDGDDEYDPSADVEDSDDDEEIHTFETNKQVKNYRQKTLVTATTTKKKNSRSNNRQRRRSPRHQRQRRASLRSSAKSDDLTSTSEDDDKLEYSGAGDDDDDSLSSMTSIDLDDFAKNSLLGIVDESQIGKTASLEQFVASWTPKIEAQTGKPKSRCRQRSRSRRKTPPQQSQEQSGCVAAMTTARRKSLTDVTEVLGELCGEFSSSDSSVVEVARIDHQPVKPGNTKQTLEWTSSGVGDAVIHRNIWDDISKYSIASSTRSRKLRSSRRSPRSKSFEDHRVKPVRTAPPRRRSLPGGAVASTRSRSSPRLIAAAAVATNVREKRSKKTIESKTQIENRKVKNSTTEETTTSTPTSEITLYSDDISKSSLTEEIQPKKENVILGVFPGSAPQEEHSPSSEILPSGGDNVSKTLLADDSDDLRVFRPLMLPDNEEDEVDNDGEILFLDDKSGVFSKKKPGDVDDYDESSATSMEVVKLEKEGDAVSVDDSNASDEGLENLGKLSSKISASKKFEDEFDGKKTIFLSSGDTRINQSQGIKHSGSSQSDHVTCESNQSSSPKDAAILPPVQSQDMIGRNDDKSSQSSPQLESQARHGNEIQDGTSDQLQCSIDSSDQSQKKDPISDQSQCTNESEKSLNETFDQSQCTIDKSDQSLTSNHKTDQSESLDIETSQTEESIHKSNQLQQSGVCESGQSQKPVKKFNQSEQSSFCQSDQSHETVDISNQSQHRSENSPNQSEDEFVSLKRMHDKSTAIYHVLSGSNNTDKRLPREDSPDYRSFITGLQFCPPSIIKSSPPHLPETAESKRQRQKSRLDELRRKLEELNDDDKSLSTASTQTISCNRPYVCPICGYDFWTLSEQQTHMSGHRQDAVSLHVNLCLEAMIERRRLGLVVNMPNFAHRCPSCEADFSGRDALGHHARFFDNYTQQYAFHSHVYTDPSCVDDNLNELISQTDYVCKTKINKDNLAALRDMAENLATPISATEQPDSKQLTEDSNIPKNSTEILTVDVKKSQPPPMKVTEHEITEFSLLGEPVSGNDVEKNLAMLQDLAENLVFNSENKDDASKSEVAVETEACKMLSVDEISTSNVDSQLSENVEKVANGRDHGNNMIIEKQEKEDGKEYYCDKSLSENPNVITNSSVIQKVASENRNEPMVMKSDDLNLDVSINEDNIKYSNESQFESQSAIINTPVVIDSEKVQNLETAENRSIENVDSDENAAKKTSSPSREIVKTTEKCEILPLNENFPVDKLEQEANLEIEKISTDDHCSDKTSTDKEINLEQMDDFEVPPLNEKFSLDDKQDESNLSNTQGEIVESTTVVRVKSPSKTTEIEISTGTAVTNSEATSADQESLTKVKNTFTSEMDKESKDVEMSDVSQTSADDMEVTEICAAKILANTNLENSMPEKIDLALEESKCECVDDSAVTKTGIELEIADLTTSDPREQLSTESLDVAKDSIACRSPRASIPDISGSIEQLSTESLDAAKDSIACRSPRARIPDTSGSIEQLSAESLDAKDSIAEAECRSPRASIPDTSGSIEQLSTESLDAKDSIAEAECRSPRASIPDTSGPIEQLSTESLDAKDSIAEAECRSSRASIPDTSGSIEQLSTESLDAKDSIAEAECRSSRASIPDTSGSIEQLSTESFDAKDSIAEAECRSPRASIPDTSGSIEQLSTESLDAKDSMAEPECRSPRASIPDTSDSIEQLSTESLDAKDSIAEAECRSPRASIPDTSGSIEQLSTESLNEKDSIAEAECRSPRASIPDTSGSIEQLSTESLDAKDSIAEAECRSPRASIPDTSGSIEQLSTESLDAKDSIAEAECRSPRASIPDTSGSIEQLSTESYDTKDSIPLNMSHIQNISAAETSLLEEVKNDDAMPSSYVILSADSNTICDSSNEISNSEVTTTQTLSDANNPVTGQTENEGFEEKTNDEALQRNIDNNGLETGIHIDNSKCETTDNDFQESRPVASNTIDDSFLLCSETLDDTPSSSPKSTSMVPTTDETLTSASDKDSRKEAEVVIEQKSTSEFTYLNASIDQKQETEAMQESMEEFQSSFKPIFADSGETNSNVESDKLQSVQLDSTNLSEAITTSGTSNISQNDEIVDQIEKLDDHNQNLKGCEVSGQTEGNSGSLSDIEDTEKDSMTHGSIVRSGEIDDNTSQELNPNTEEISMTDIESKVVETHEIDEEKVDDDIIEMSKTENVSVCDEDVVTVDVISAASSDKIKEIDYDVMEKCQPAQCSNENKTEHPGISADSPESVDITMQETITVAAEVCSLMPDLLSKVECEIEAFETSEEEIPNQQNLTELTCSENPGSPMDSVTESSEVASKICVADDSLVHPAPVAVEPELESDGGVDDSLVHQAPVALESYELESDEVISDETVDICKSIQEDVRFEMHEPTVNVTNQSEIRNEAKKEEVVLDEDTLIEYVEGDAVEKLNAAQSDSLQTIIPQNVPRSPNDGDSDPAQSVSSCAPHYYPYIPISNASAVDRIDQDSSGSHVSYGINFTDKKEIEICQESVEPKTNPQKFPSYGSGENIHCLIREKIPNETVPMELDQVKEIKIGDRLDEEESLCSMNESGQQEISEHLEAHATSDNDEECVEFKDDGEIDSKQVNLDRQETQSGSTTESNTKNNQFVDQNLIDANQSVPIVSEQNSEIIPPESLVKTGENEKVSDTIQKESLPDNSTPVKPDDNVSEVEGESVEICKHECNNELELENNATDSNDKQNSSYGNFSDQPEESGGPQIDAVSLTVADNCENLSEVSDSPNEGLCDQVNVSPTEADAGSEGFDSLQPAVYDAPKLSSTAAEVSNLQILETPVELEVSNSHKDDEDKKIKDPLIPAEAGDTPEVSDLMVLSEAGLSTENCTSSKDTCNSVVKSSMPLDEASNPMSWNEADIASDLKASKEDSHSDLVEAGAVSRKPDSPGDAQSSSVEVSNDLFSERSKEDSHSDLVEAGDVCRKPDSPGDALSSSSVEVSNDLSSEMSNDGKVDLNTSKDGSQTDLVKAGTAPGKHNLPSTHQCSSVEAPASLGDVSKEVASETATDSKVENKDIDCRSDVEQSAFFASLSLQQGPAPAVIRSPEKPSGNTRLKRQRRLSENMAANSSAVRSTAVESTKTSPTKSPVKKARSVAEAQSQIAEDGSTKEVAKQRPRNMQRTPDIIKVHNLRSKSSGSGCPATAAAASEHGHNLRKKLSQVKGSERVTRPSQRAKATSRSAQSTDAREDKLKWKAHERATKKAVRETADTKKNEKARGSNVTKDGGSRGRKLRTADKKTVAEKSLKEVKNSKSSAVELVADLFTSEENRRTSAKLVAMAILDDNKTSKVETESSIASDSETSEAPKFEKVIINDSKIESLPRTLIRCEHCAVQLETHASAVRHMRVHNMQLKDDDKNHACAICAKKFICEFLLDEHIRLTHASGYNLVCPKCPERFMWRILLEEHMESCHVPIAEELQAETVNTSPKSFKRRKNKPSDAKSRFTCHLCSNTSIGKANHRKHMRLHGYGPCMECDLFKPYHSKCRSKECITFRKTAAEHRRKIAGSTPSKRAASATIWKRRLDDDAGDDAGNIGDKKQRVKNEPSEKMMKIFEKVPPASTVTFLSPEKNKLESDEIGENSGGAGRGQWGQRLHLANEDFEVTFLNEFKPDVKKTTEIELKEPTKASSANNETENISSSTAANDSINSTVVDSVVTSCDVRTVAPGNQTSPPRTNDPVNSQPQSLENDGKVNVSDNVKKCSENNEMYRRNTGGETKTEPAVNTGIRVPGAPVQMAVSPKPVRKRKMTDRLLSYRQEVQKKNSKTKKYRKTVEDERFEKADDSDDEISFRKSALPLVQVDWELSEQGQGDVENNWQIPDVEESGVINEPIISLSEAVRQAKDQQERGDIPVPIAEIGDALVEETHPFVVENVHIEQSPIADNTADIGGDDNVQKHLTAAQTECVESRKSNVERQQQVADEITSSVTSRQQSSLPQSDPSRIAQQNQYHLNEENSKWNSLKSSSSSSSTSSSPVSWQHGRFLAGATYERRRKKQLSGVRVSTKRTSEDDGDGCKYAKKPSTRIGKTRRRSQESPEYSSRRRGPAYSWASLAQHGFSVDSSTMDHSLTIESPTKRSSSVEQSKLFGTDTTDGRLPIKSLVVVRPVSVTSLNQNNARLEESLSTASKQDTSLAKSQTTVSDRMDRLVRTGGLICSSKKSLNPMPSSSNFQHSKATTRTIEHVSAELEVQTNYHLESSKDDAPVVGQKQFMDIKFTQLATRRPSTSSASSYVDELISPEGESEVIASYAMNALKRLSASAQQQPSQPRPLVKCEPHQQQQQQQEQQRGLTWEDIVRGKKCSSSPTPSICSSVMSKTPTQTYKPYKPEGMPPPCEVCGEKNDLWATALSHLISHRDSHAAGRYNCEHCGKRFQWQLLYSYHIQVCQSLNNDANNA